MNKILIYRKMNVWNSTDYKKLNNEFLINGFNGYNFGNHLWYQGLISEISTPENEIDYFDPSMSIGKINETYNLVIYPMANIFSREFSSGLIELAKFTKQLKIPIFIISCGIQLKHNESIKELCADIGTVSKQFISAVYETGGQFALRGYETAQFFNELGFKNPAVVGCPSLFQCGRDLKITKKDVSEKDFKPAINGNIEISSKLLIKYSNSIYYDQDVYWNLLYNSEYYKDKSNIKKLNSILSMDTYDFALSHIINENRIRLIADMWDWKYSFKQENITMTFGTRIHGNVMSLLAGVPALIAPHDIRVKEMADFYEIPNISIEQLQKNDNINLYRLYESLDYSDFNKHFPDKYDAFENFLVECGIIERKMVSDNQFFKKEKTFDKNNVSKESIDIANYILNHTTISKKIKLLLDRKNKFV